MVITGTANKRAWFPLYGEKMSSTNRSEARKEHISDYYITPQKQIELFLKEFEKDCDVFKNPNVKILDPCAGGDIQNEMSLLYVGFTVMKSIQLISGKIVVQKLNVIICLIQYQKIMTL